MATTFEYQIDKYHSVPVHIVNPEDFYPLYHNAPFARLHVFQFGAYGDTWVAVWEHHLEDALEEAAGWLADNEPGHLTSEKEMGELIKEAAKELEVDISDVDDWGEEPYSDVLEAAEADMTYTESGWLTSYEWFVNEVDPSEPLYLDTFDASWEPALEENLLDEDQEELVEDAYVKLTKMTKRNA